MAGIMADNTGRARGGRRPRVARLGRIATGVVAVVALLMSMTAVASADGHSSTITSDGIGHAVLGSSANQLRGQLGAGWTVEPAEPFLVDIEGYEVFKGGASQFFAGRSVDADDLTDDTPLTSFFVFESGLSTGEGIGVDSTIAEGIAAYGAATVFTSEIEGRQFTTFENQPDRISFRTTNAGDYGDDDELGEAPAINEDGVITQVWITCGPGTDNCPSIPELPDTGIGVSGIVAISIGLMVLGVALRLLDRRMRRRYTARPEWVADW